MHLTTVSSKNLLMEIATAAQHQNVIIHLSQFIKGTENEKNSDNYNIFISFIIL